MSDEKIISLKKYKRSKKINAVKSGPAKIWSETLRLKRLFLDKIGENRKMFFIVVIVSAILASFIWNVFVESPANFDVQIPISNNISFNGQEPIKMSAAQVANEFENYEGKPVLLYIYTTWCSSCMKQHPVINDLAREFQNTQLQVIALAIDKDLTANNLQAHLNRFGNLYFKPYFLGFKEGFLGFLKKRNINYTGRIPLTVLISGNGEIKAKFVGSKSKRYLRNKIIKELY